MGNLRFNKKPKTSHTRFQIMCSTGNFNASNLPSAKITTNAVQKHFFRTYWAWFIVILLKVKMFTGPSGAWWHGSWIYNYLCNRCLSSLMLWVRLPLRAGLTPLCDKVCQWLATGWWFSLCTPVSSTNKIDHHDIAEILLKVALNTIISTNKIKIVKETQSWTLLLSIDKTWLS